MKKLYLVPLMVILILGLISISCAQPAPAPAPAAPKPAAPSPASAATAPAKPIELTFSTWVPEQTANAQWQKAWIKNVEEKTSGRVKLTYYGAGALGNSVEHFDLAVKKTADITYFNFSSARGRFPMAEAMQTPFIFPSAEIAGKVLWKLYQEFPELQKELSAVKVIGLDCTDPVYIFTTAAAGQVKTLEDLKGKKIRTSGIESDTLGALGATPTAIVDMSEVYLALQKGVVDGAAYAIQAVKAFKYGEVLKYYTIWEGASVRVLPEGLFMNLDSWNKLPPDIQKIMGTDLGVGGSWFSPWASKYYDDFAKISRKAIDDEYKGIVYTLSQAELNRWIEKIMPVREKIINDLEAKGLPGKKYVGRMLELVKEFSK